MRDVSCAIVVETPLLAALEQVDEGRIDHVFTLNMGIYKLKYSMNLLMNAMHHLAVAAALGGGEWFATTGRIDVSTVVDSETQRSMGRHRKLVTRTLGRPR